MSIRRPFSVLSAAGTAAHHGFEVRAGVGLVFEPFLDRGGALALWSALLPATATAAAFGGRDFDRPLAAGTAAALAGGVVHYVQWPWRLRRGVPMLTEAEGLRPDQLPAYNAVLLTWIAASAIALARETPRSAWRETIVGLLSGIPLLFSARHHFAWAREQAQKEPEKWSPALR